MFSHLLGLRAPRTVHSLLLLFSICGALYSEESSLAVLSAGVQQSDDASFVTADYRFLPSDPLYVMFTVGGFKVKSEGDKPLRTMDLHWEVTALDANDVPLAPPASGEIADELSPEDRKWTPKRRATFTLPHLVPAGEYHLRIAVHDKFAETTATRDVPFRIGGVRIEPAEQITAQHIEFSREENGPALEAAAYRPGDTVYANFRVAGFASGPQHEYSVSYGLTVLRPDGKVYLEQANAAEFKDAPFYPARYLPGNLEILTKPNSALGNYILVLTLKDEVSGKTFVTRRNFSIE